MWTWTRNLGSRTSIGPTLPRGFVTRSLIAVIALALLGGCARLGQDSDGGLFDRRTGDGPVLVEIQNDHFNDARIYANWNGNRRRVGVVIGKTVETLEVEWMAQDLRLEVNLIAAGGFVTDPVQVWPGETIYLRIPGWY